MQIGQGLGQQPRGGFRAFTGSAAARAALLAWRRFAESGAKASARSAKSVARLAVRVESAFGCGAGRAKKGAHAIGIGAGDFLIGGQWNGHDGLLGRTDIRCPNYITHLRRSGATSFGVASVHQANVSRGTRARMAETTS